MIRYYNELTRLEMEQVNKDNTLVLIPIGSLEQHGNHLPLGTDTMIANELTSYISREQDKSLEVLIFPTISVGLSTEHHNFCGSITLKPETLYNLLDDICTNISYHGFKKIVFLNAHGGNSPIIQILSRELRIHKGINIFTIQSAFWDKPEVKATISEGNIWDFHGGEMETSMVMAIDEELVKLDTSVAGKPKHIADNKELGLFGPISITWVGEDWVDDKGNPIGIGGDPSGATAQKGKVILQSFTESIVQGLVNINRW